jgi:hypothetical protein
LEWADPPQWREANDTLAGLFARRGPDLDPVRRAAGRARSILEVLSDRFDRWTAVVCPSCRTICCQHARVAYGFRDLVFLHALNLCPPPLQLRDHDDAVCRYLGPQGCDIERIRRPFVCTWYYCGPMLDLYYDLRPREQRRLSGLMTDAQKYLGEMEDLFIRAL